MFGAGGNNLMERQGNESIGDLTDTIRGQRGMSSLLNLLPPTKLKTCIYFWAGHRTNALPRGLRILSRI